MAAANEKENDHFRDFLLAKDTTKIDEMVHAINKLVEPAIDCTQCGACCKTLMINVSQEEAEIVSGHLKISTADFKEKYIEESMQGKYIINSIPCHFLEDNKCNIYEDRFSGCREFPHMDRKNFKDRLFGTLMYYAMCPIIFNVVEELKIATGFKTEGEKNYKKNRI